MPRFRAVDIEVQLCTTPLDGTTTTNPDDLAIGRGKKELEYIESRLLNAHHLPERLVKDGEDDGVVRFLGDFDKSPFFLVRAGHMVKANHTAANSALSVGQDTKPHETRTRSTAVPKSTTSTAPRPVFNQRSSLNTGAVTCHNDGDALAIVVDVSHVSMRPGVDGKPMDLKIELYYNGDFTGYKLLHARYGAKKVFFGGHRLYTTFERPMVFRRPDEASPTTLSQSQRYQACKKRWQLINRSLYQEAALRGLDERNRPLPITAYLSALATYGFPTDLANSTSPPLDVNMGVIDVVVSVGHGKKRAGDDAYSYHPTRLVDTLHHSSIPINQNELGALFNNAAYPDTPVDSASTQSEISAGDPQNSVTNHHNDEEEVPPKPAKIKLRLRRNKKEDSSHVSSARNISADIGSHKSPQSIPTTPASSRRLSPAQIMEESLAWQLPELSQGSVATYATLETLRENHAGITPGMCRQVRKERSGEFTEESVLMGVRFVVG